MWILPAISETLIKCLQLPIFGPFSCCESWPRLERGETGLLLGCPGPAGILVQSRAMALPFWGQG